MQSYIGQLVQFKNEAASVILGYGIIRNIINVSLEECTVVGTQAIRILEAYPCNYNPVLYESFVKTQDTSKVVDIWDSPYAAYDEHLVSIKDVSKIIWEGHPYALETRNRHQTIWNNGNSGAATNTEDEGHAYGANFDNGNYTKTATYNHKVFGDTEPVAGSERFFTRARFLVPKRQGTNFTSVKVKMTFKRGYADHYGLGNTPGLYQNYDWTTLYFWNEVAGVITGVGGFDERAFPNEFGVRYIGSDIRHGFEPIADKISDYTEFAKVEAAFGLPATAFKLKQSFEGEITEYLTFTEGEFFHSKTAYNDEGLDTFFFDLLIGTGFKPSVLGDMAMGSSFHDIKLVVNYDSDQILPFGSGRIESVTADTINFDTVEHPSPWPLNDAWSTQDLLQISKKIGTIIADILASSGADNIFSVSFNDFPYVTDTIDRTLTYFLPVLQIYAERAGAEFWEDNLTIYFRRVFAGSGITITEGDIYLYPESVKLVFNGGAYGAIIVVGLEERTYELAITPATNAQGRKLIEYKSDVINQQTAQKVVEGMKNKHEAEVYSITFPLRSTVSYVTNLRIGALADITLDNLTIVNGFIESIEHYEGETMEDFLKVTVTNFYRS